MLRNLLMPSVFLRVYVEPIVKDEFKTMISDHQCRQLMNKKAQKKDSFLQCIAELNKELSVCNKEIKKLEEEIKQEEGEIKKEKSEVKKEEIKVKIKDKLESKRHYCYKAAEKQYDAAMLYAACPSLFYHEMPDGERVDKELSDRKITIEDYHVEHYAQGEELRFSYFLKYSTDAMTNLLEAKKSQTFNLPKTNFIVENLGNTLRKINTYWHHPARGFYDPLPVKIADRGNLGAGLKQIKMPSSEKKQRSMCSRFLGFFNGYLWSDRSSAPLVKVKEVEKKHKLQ